MHTSTGYRCPWYDGSANDTSEPLPGTINSKIIPGRSANVTTPREHIGRGHGRILYPAPFGRQPNYDAEWVVPSQIPQVPDLAELHVVP
ncbi:hypothetical protein ABZ590_13600 [Streptomyces hirsutus]|uniref:hypothetical protein n=1 Tax=Streptomyces hirsutus TaxID=35620 RepID=UPI0033E07252